MARLADLQATKTIGDVARLLDIKPSILTYILYSKFARPKFRTFSIPKASGGTRVIEAPNGPLKLLQRRLADLLQDCDQEVRERYGRHDGGPHPDKVTHGFVRRRSIVTNAYQHRRRRFVFNIDLDDFFPSINFGRVRGYFIRDKNFALEPAVATVLAQIACSGNHLPQGSPCSPVIANLITHILDVHLVRLADRNGCQYTRYADDLTFSTNKKEFPRSIAVRLNDDSHQWSAGAELARLIDKCGFKVNAKKTRMQYRESRQSVTGLVVNEKVNVANDYRRTVRAMVHRLLKTGSFDVKGPSTVSVPKSTKAGTLRMLHGMLGFIDSIEAHSQKQQPKSHRPTLTSTEKTYRRFLLFKDFYAAAEPMVVCEGKTDTVYLTHAIRSLGKFFPRLASVDASGKVTLKIRRYRYALSSTGRILGLGGGTGDLKNLLLAYRDALSRFEAKATRNAVIVLIDNDSGADSVLAMAREINGRTALRTDQFTHVIENLYVVPTPLLPGAKTSAVEDYFDTTTRSTKLNGKSFSSSNHYSPSSHYGKADFAYQVVQRHAKTIDFRGFYHLLHNISLAIEDYAVRAKP
jgi:RNA-directed DNA polymerase